MNDSIVQLNGLLKKVRAKEQNDTKTKWRFNEAFMRPENADKFEPGCMDFAPAWFGLAHEVSQNFSSM